MTTITTRVVSVEAYDAMKEQRDALAARLAEAERLLHHWQMTANTQEQAPVYIETSKFLRAADSASEVPK